MPAPAEYVYIAGRGRSGSTLLELLLGAHPEIVALGEIEKLSLQFARDGTGTYPGRCSCGKPPIECPIWSRVAEEIKRAYGVDLSTDPFAFRVSDVGWEEDYGPRALRHWLLYKGSRVVRSLAYSAEPLRRRLSFVWPLHRRWVSNRLFVADVVRKASRARCVVDSSKDYLAMREIYDQGSGVVKIIALTRDVRATAWSEFRSGARLESAARAWAKVNARIFRMLEAVPADDWIHIRYEDLCRDVAGTARRICGFLGYDYVPAMTGDNQADRHTIGGNRIRFKPLGAIEEDLSWQANLFPHDLTQIERVAGALARKLGY